MYRKRKHFLILSMHKESNVHWKINYLQKQNRKSYMYNQVQSSLVETVLIGVLAWKLLSSWMDTYLLSM